MTPIQTNKPVFFDTDGSVLEGGSIYIGQPSTDPRTSPKTVTFRDSGGSEFTAAQPLETIAGRISYNGKPIVALVDGEYSMLIISANGQQVDYARSVNSAGTSGGGIADFSEVTRVGLTLSEIKTFDSSVGDIIENIGKTSAEDKGGARWLVFSATGTPGDDANLIDLTNGLQAKRVNSYSPRVIWTGDSTSVNMASFDVADRGAGRYLVYVGSTYAELSVTDSASFTRSLLDSDLGSGFLSVSVARFSSFSGSFTAVKQEINNITTSPATTETNLNITKIEKF